MRIETWTSTDNNMEVHHFLGKSKAIYLFGINPWLISTTAYKKILKIVEEELSTSKDVIRIANKK